jgi:protein-tyrosine phosphatase
VPIPSSILLHNETPDGSVVPIWEEASAQDVAVFKEIMSSKQADGGVGLAYYKVPITSERPPDFSDISDLMQVVMRADSEKTPIVLNCQLGRGRSTITSVCVMC